MNSFLECCEKKTHQGRSIAFYIISVSQLIGTKKILTSVISVRRRDIKYSWKFGSWNTFFLGFRKNRWNRAMPNWHTLRNVRHWFDTIQGCCVRWARAHPLIATSTIYMVIGRKLNYFSWKHSQYGFTPVVICVYLLRFYLCFIQLTWCCPTKLIKCKILCLFSSLLCTYIYSPVVYFKMLYHLVFSNQILSFYDCFIMLSIVIYVHLIRKQLLLIKKNCKMDMMTKI